MHEFHKSRAFRFFVCLILVCCVLVNSSPIKASADVVTGTLGAIASASVVSVPVSFWVVAGLVALGVMADVVTDPAYNGYDALVDNATAFLTDAGTYVKDGMVEMIRVVDETGKAVFYTAGDALESLRGWLFDSGTVVNSVPQLPSTASAEFQSAFDFAASQPYAALVHFGASSSDTWAGQYLIVYSDTPLVVSEFNSSFFKITNEDEWFSYWDSLTRSWLTASSKNFSKDSALSLFGTQVPEFTTLDGLTLGQISSVPIDGTGARQWSEEYTNNGLHIVGGGSGNNNNNGKWFWPLAFGLTIAELIAMYQAEQWTGETPSEFSEYETIEELTVSPGEEVEFGQSIELSPVTDPDTGTDTGTDTDPDAGTDTGDSSGSDDSSGSSKPPKDPDQYILVDLTKFFPFCIPFDLFEFFKLLCAEPVAPVLYWEIQDLAGETYSISIDLSAWDSVALLFRRLQLFLFITGLAVASRKYIKW